MNLHRQHLLKEVRSYVPHLQKRIVDKIVTLTIRLLADEFQKSPYAFIGWLGRYQGSMIQYEKPTKKGFFHDDTSS